MKLSDRNKDKIKSYVGFAIRAGKAIFGVDQILVSGKRIHLILADVALSANSKQKLMNFAEKKGIPWGEWENIGELTALPFCKAVGIREPYLAKAILQTEVSEKSEKEL